MVTAKFSRERQYNCHRNKIRHIPINLRIDVYAKDIEGDALVIFLFGETIRNDAKDIYKHCKRQYILNSFFCCFGTVYIRPSSWVYCSSAYKIS